MAISPLIERTRSVIAREASETWSAIRSAPRHVVVGELVFFLFAFGFGLLPLWISELSPWQTTAATASASWAALLVPARRRWPVATLLAMSPILVGNNFGAMAILPVVAYSTARRINSSRLLWRTVLVTMGVSLVLSVVVKLSLSMDLIALFASYAGNIVLLLLLPVWAGSLLGRRRPLVQLLRERNEYLEQAQMLTGEKARMKERARIASEMHDMLGHRLSLISIHAGALEFTTAGKAPQLSSQAELLRTTAGTALTELREILAVLRDPAEGATDTVDERSGTQADIAELVTESQRAGIAVDLAWFGEDLDTADPRTRHAVHRVVREALTNVHKHASTAHTRVEVSNNNGHIRVRVINGPVPGVRQRGAGTRQGLVGLEERITLLHGAFVASPTPEGGFQVMADLPVHPPVPMPSAPVAPRDVPERPKPLDAEVLTLPRALGAGCLGLMAVVPVSVGSAALIIARALQ